MEAVGLSGGEEHRDLPLLRGAVPWPHIHHHREAHSHLLHDHSHHSLHSSVAFDPRLFLAAARNAGQDTSRYVEKSKASPYSITERRVPELIPVLGSQPAGDVCHKGATENARHENTGRSKMQDLKMRDMNLRHQLTRVENARHENAAPCCRGGKCETWKCGTKLHGWKMREKLVWKAKVWKSVSY